VALLRERRRSCRTPAGRGVVGRCVCVFASVAFTTRARASRCVPLVSCPSAASDGGVRAHRPPSRLAPSAGARRHRQLGTSRMRRHPPAAHAAAASNSSSAPRPLSASPCVAAASVRALAAPTSSAGSTFAAFCVRRAAFGGERFIAAALCTTRECALTARVRPPANAASTGCLAQRAQLCTRIGLRRGRGAPAQSSFLRAFRRSAAMAASSADDWESMDVGALSLKPPAAKPASPAPPAAPRAAPRRVHCAVATRRCRQPAPLACTRPSGAHACATPASCVVPARRGLTRRVTRPPFSLPNT
jgi:hypothetical protein